MAKGKSKRKQEEERITMKALEEMSDSDDEQVPQSQWSTKAKNLQKDIEGGKFDKLLGALKKAKEEGKVDDFEEDSLDSSSESDGDDADNKEGEVDDEQEEVDDEQEEDASSSEEDQVEKEHESDSEKDEDQVDDDDESEREEEDEREGADKVKEIFAKEVKNDSDREDSEDDDDDDEASDKALRMIKNNRVNSKALAVVTAELVASHSHLPWGETFDVIPPTPLPFGEKPDPESGTSPLDIHDDLKREVAFYNCALEAVHEARTRCKKANIPFSRPEDFFAEMIKTDGKWSSKITMCAVAVYNYLLILSLVLQITWQRLRIDSSSRRKRLMQ
jgi:Eukaryotic rRNA processing protein EBP2